VLTLPPPVLILPPLGLTLAPPVLTLPLLVLTLPPLVLTLPPLVLTPPLLVLTLPPLVLTPPPSVLTPPLFDLPLSLVILIQQVGRVQIIHLPPQPDIDQQLITNPPEDIAGLDKASVLRMGQFATAVQHLEDVFGGGFAGEVTRIRDGVGRHFEGSGFGHDRAPCDMKGMVDGPSNDADDLLRIAYCVSPKEEST
jgi:hypothetical protein